MRRNLYISERLDWDLVEYMVENDFDNDFSREVRELLRDGIKYRQGETMDGTEPRRASRRPAKPVRKSAPKPKAVIQKQEEEFEEENYSDETNSLAGDLEPKVEKVSTDNEIYDLETDEESQEEPQDQNNKNSVQENNEDFDDEDDDDDFDFSKLEIKEKTVDDDDLDKKLNKL